MSPVVRRASEDDARAIASIHVRGWQSAYPGIVPDAYLDALSADNYAERHRGRIRLPQSGVEAWVAESDGAVAGFAILGPARPPLDEPPAGEVYAIYVDPGRLRRGIGRLLLDHAVEAFRRQGLGLATLWVLRENAPGRRFYEAMGWRADGSTQRFELPGFGGVSLPEVRYVRDLG